MPKRKSPEEVAEQDARIAAAAAAGDSTKVIAEREGISDRWVRARLKRMGASVRSAKVFELPEPEPVVIDPFREVARALAAQSQAEREARRLAGDASQDAVRVAALKLVGDLVRDRIELLDRIGMLPTGPAFVDELRLRAAWVTLSEFLADAGLDLDAVQEAFVNRVAERVRFEESSGNVSLEPLTPLPLPGRDLKAAA